MLKFQTILKIRNIWITATVLLFSCVPALNAQELNSPYGIDDENELFTVLGFNEYPAKTLNLKKDILIDKGNSFNIHDGDEIIFNLNEFNLTGTGNFEFHVVDPLTDLPMTPPGSATIRINGSTAGFNGGLKIYDNIDLTYNGTYISSDLDILGVNNGDHVTVNFTEPGSGWNATAATPKFIDEIPLPNNLYDLAKLHEGTIIVGGDGVGHLNVTNGNWVRNAETIVGARNSTDPTWSDVLISGRGTNWYAAGTFYIGYEGKGYVNIEQGAQVSAGSVGVGVAAPTSNNPNIGIGNGILNVRGTGVKLPDSGVGVPNEKDHYWILDKDSPNNPTKGYVTNSIEHGIVSQSTVYDATHRTVFKTNEANKLDNTTTVSIFGRKDDDLLKSRGAGVMYITEGAHLIFDEHATETGKVSGYIPKLTLGTGNSFVDNSLVSGALKNWRDKNNSLTGIIDGNTTKNNSLTFQNGSILEGTLAIKMDANNFTTGSVITPGYEMYEYPFVDPQDKHFGRLDFTNSTLTLDETVKTYIDFDAHGDINAVKSYANHPIVPTQGPGLDPLVDNLIFGKDPLTEVTSKGYLPDNGRDFITSTGKVTLDGDIYFRPQAGYYSDHIDVNFLEVSSGYIDKQFDASKVHVEPARWFENARLGIAGSGDYRGDHLLMDRAEKPFNTAGDDFNTKSVGGALDSIYNANNNYSWLHILDWVWLMNDDELRTAMHQLAGEAKASSFYMPLRNQWRYAFDRVNWSKSGNNVYFGTQNVNNPKLAKNDLWVTPYYDYFHAGSDGNISSTTIKRVSFMAGYDHAFQKTPYFGCVSKSAFGLIFGYSQPKMDQGSSRIIADDYMLGAHFDTRLYEKYELKLWGGLGAQQYRLNRNVPVPKVDGDLHSKYTGTSWSGSVQVARPLYYRDTVVIRPLAALDVMSINQNSAQEEGSYKQIILGYQRSKWNQLFGRIGIRADYAYRQMNLTGSLGYSYLLLGDQAPISTHRFVYAGGNSFDVQGNNLGRSFVAMSLGTQLNLDRLKTSVVFLQYNGDYSKHSNGQTFSIGYQKLF